MWAAEVSCFASCRAGWAVGRGWLTLFFWSGPVFGTQGEAQRMIKARLGWRCLAAAKIEEQQKWKALGWKERSLGSFGCSCVFPSPLNLCLLSVYRYSPLPPSVSPHSYGHFLILIALSHQCQLIIEHHFVIIYCAHRECWARAVEKRWEKSAAYMRNGWSQFPVAVKHLARALNNQSLRAAYECVCVCMCVCVKRE